MAILVSLDPLEPGKFIILEPALASTWRLILASLGSIKKFAIALSKSSAPALCGFVLLTDFFVPPGRLTLTI